ncbi:unnamed protein product, partial [Ixodes persulcatus]
TGPSCPAHLEATQSLQKRTRAGHRRNVHTHGPPPLDPGVGNWPTLPTSNRFGILASSRSRSRSKGPAQDQSARGSRTLKRSRSRRPNTLAPPPPSPVHNRQPFRRSRSSSRQNSTSHDLPRPLNNVIGQAFPPTREVNGSNSPHLPTSTATATPPSPPQIPKPIISQTDIQEIVRKALDQILPSLLQQIITPLLNQALAPLLSTLNDLTARIVVL